MNWLIAGVGLMVVLAMVWVGDSERRPARVQRLMDRVHHPEDCHVCRRRASREHDQRRVDDWNV